MSLLPASPQGGLECNLNLPLRPAPGPPAEELSGLPLAGAVGLGASKEEEKEEDEKQEQEGVDSWQDSAPSSPLPAEHAPLSKTRVREEDKPKKISIREFLTCPSS